MSFWERLFGKVKKEESIDSTEENYLESQICDEDMSDSLDLGWYYSENKNEFQMAKIVDEDRATHFYVIGATGTGKTKFLEFLISQDIKKGNGFGVIDPHGDLVEDIKGFLAEHFEQEKDHSLLSEKLVLIDPTDLDFYCYFQPIRELPNISVTEQAGELISAFKKIWSDAWGVRMEDLLRNSLIALGEAEFSFMRNFGFFNPEEFQKKRYW